MFANVALFPFHVSKQSANLNQLTFVLAHVTTANHFISFNHVTHFKKETRIDLRIFGNFIFNPGPTPTPWLTLLLVLVKSCGNQKWC